MKTIVIAALLALSFTTGFTCSKNTPAPEAAPATTETTTTTESTTTAPADAAAAPAEGEAAPAAPAGETH